jgi:hypothetical protein
MLRRLLLTACAGCWPSCLAFAQAPLTIDDLSAPTSPGFVLLDVAPASVERPETPKAFTLNLLNKVASARGLPQNYAFEVTPYWMRAHPNLTFHQYQRPTTWQSIAQTFSVSVATVPLPGATTGADPAGTRLAFGGRVSIANGQPNAKLEELVDALHAVDDEILDAVNKGQTVSPELRATAREAAASVQAADAERVGFFLVVASGQTWTVPNDDLDRSAVQRRAFWITPSYRLGCRAAAACGPMLDVIGVVRGLKDADKDFAWDYGGRLVWRPTREFNLSVESLGRTNGTATPGASTPANNRTVGLVEYRIRQDLAIYGSFGRDFKTDTGIRPLVSLMGLNVGVGKKATVKADQKPAP